MPPPAHASPCAFLPRRLVVGGTPYLAAYLDGADADNRAFALAYCQQRNASFGGVGTLRRGVLATQLAAYAAAVQTYAPSSRRTCAGAACPFVAVVECVPQGAAPCSADELGNIGWVPACLLRACCYSGALQLGVGCQRVRPGLSACRQQLTRCHAVHSCRLGNSGRDNVGHFNTGNNNLGSRNVGANNVGDMNTASGCLGSHNAEDDSFGYAGSGSLVAPADMRL